mgnify:CR=1 FL=1
MWHEVSFEVMLGGVYGLHGLAREINGRRSMEGLANKGCGKTLAYVEPKRFIRSCNAAWQRVDRHGLIDAKI